MKLYLLAVMMSASVACSAAADIPFWGQGKPDLARRESASATWTIPEGYDIRVFSRCLSEAIAFNTGAPGIVLVFR